MRNTVSSGDAATAVAKHVDEGGPSGTAKYRATSGCELAETSDEESYGENGPSVGTVGEGGRFLKIPEKGVEADCMNG